MNSPGLRILAFCFALAMLRGAAVRANEPALVGAGGCATFWCHGSTLPGNAPAWRSSYVRWARHDPHAGAFHTLFSERSARIVQRLRVEPRIAETDLAHREQGFGAKDETAYWRVLARRCIGCHATSAGDVVAEWPLSAGRVDSLAEGVSCESCHGGAGKWLTEHATSRWPSYAPDEKRGGWGMADTKSLSGRAAVCVECHVGPHQTPAGNVMDVDHGLIAAGHPRLAFEFSAYLSNLPRHWDEARDRSRHGAATFHFDAWRVGQMETARKLANQIEIRTPSGDAAAPGNGWLEFSNFDCYACHHRLRSDRHPAAKIETRQARTALTNPASAKPTPLDWPFSQLHAIAASSTQADVRGIDQELTSARERMTFGFRESPASRRTFFAELHRRLAICSQSALNEQLTRKDRAAILHRLLAELTAEQTLRWDRVVQFQLACAAFAADLEPGEPDSVRITELTQQLTEYLDGQFDASNTIYDSPARFDPLDDELRQHLRRIEAELRPR